MSGRHNNRSSGGARSEAEVTQTPSHPAAPSGERKDAILYARATREEKRRIAARADESGLSLSRYMVRASMEGRPPVTREERARLEALIYLLKRASLAVSTLRVNLAGMRLAGAHPALMEELEETERVLKRLAAEVGRRL